MALSALVDWALVAGVFFIAGAVASYGAYRLASRRREADIRREILERGMIVGKNQEIRVQKRRLKHTAEAPVEQSLVMEKEWGEIAREPQSSTDLDRALTDAVYRAITDRKAGLNLTLSFPERAKIFGQEVPVKGSVVIDGAEHEEVVRLERRIAELEETLSKKNERAPIPGGALAAEENPLF